MSENSTEERIQILTALTEQLNDILALERAALTDRDLAALTEATDNKVTVCKQIESATRDLGPLPLSEQLASLDAVDRAALEPLHKKLVAVSEKSREYNAVNGKIVHRSQQSVRELIKLMSGTDADLLYGESGQTLVKAKRTAIAKA